MGQFLIDANYNKTPILEGPPRGGIVTITSTESNDWHRLMPSQNTGVRITEVAGGADYERMLDLGYNSPLPLAGWRLRILNAGYQQIFKVVKHNNDIVTLSAPIEHRETLPAAVEWVLFPDNILPITLHNLETTSGDGDTLTIGVLTDPKSYAVSDGNVVELDRLRSRESLSIPTNAGDQICYKRGTALSGNNEAEIAWSEGIIGDYR